MIKSDIWFELYPAFMLECCSVFFHLFFYRVLSLKLFRGSVRHSSALPMTCFCWKLLKLVSVCWELLDSSQPTDKFAAINKDVLYSELSRKKMKSWKQQLHEPYFSHKHWHCHRSMFPTVDSVLFWVFFSPDIMVDSIRDEGDEVYTMLVWHLWVLFVAVKNRKILLSDFHYTSSLFEISSPYFDFISAEKKIFVKITNSFIFLLLSRVTPSLRSRSRFNCKTPYNIPPLLHTQWQ